MPLTKDTERPVKITTPLGANKMHVIHLHGTEAVNEPYAFHVDVAATDLDLDPAKLLGHVVEIEIEPFLVVQSSDIEARKINGVVNTLSIGEVLDVDVRRYHLEIVAPFHLLNYSSHCRIYQEMSAKDVISSVLDDHATPYRFDLQGGDPPVREYCVQYRESDLAFVQRLIEFEGLHYYFEPTDGGDTMVITDGLSGYKAGKDVTYEPVNFDRGVNFATGRQTSFTLGTGKVTHTDWNFKEVKVVTGEASSVSMPYEGVSKFTQHDHAPLFTEDQRGAKLSTFRSEAHDGNHYGSGLRTHYPTMRPGTTLAVKNWDHSSDKAVKMALQRVEHALTAPLTHYTNSVGGQYDYVNTAFGVPADKPWRPQQSIPRPLVHGPQTAIVVGPSGQEIYPDEHGRVKVQFHWDREGKNDEQSSCWIRVQQHWSGPGFGFQFIPRIGMEVVVTFIEGDPDRPLITGCVYNGKNKFPYKLPDNKTQSGIKTRSSKGGKNDNYNEIRFEDLKGSEELYIQAEKDYNRKVKNNESAWIGNNRKVEIVNNHTRIVNKGDETITIQKGDRSVTVEKGDSLHTVDSGDHNITVSKGDQAITVAKGNQITDVSMGNQTIEVGMGNQTTDVKMGNISMKAGLGSISLEAMQSIELKVGANSLKIDNMGVTISGLMVKIDGTATLETNAPMATYKGMMVTVQGALVKIN